jgi:hypothetical protein
MGFGTVFALVPPMPAITWSGVGDVTVIAPAGECSATVNFNVTATEGGSPLQVIFSPPSGSVLPMGITSVSCTATDPSGNSVSTSFNVTVTTPTPAVSGLNPSTVTGGGPDFTLTVNGCGFENGATVEWNGAALSTAFVSAQQLLASIPASDISLNNAAINTANITVLNPDSGLSNPQPLTIATAVVAASQSQIAPPGQTVTASAPPAAPGQAGVAASLDNSAGTQPVTVTAATYTADPTSGTSFDTGSGFVDIKVSGATAQSSLTAYFYYPAGQSAPNLFFYNGTIWTPVLGHSGALPVNDTSNGRLIVVLDSTSTPAITDLTGTPFALATKAKQTIAFTGIPPQVYSGQILSLTAGSSSGLPVSFSVISGPAILNGNMLTLTGVGQVVVAASQAGNNYYYAAPTISQTILASYQPAGLSCSGNPGHVILQPINAAGSSVFKQGSTVPAKFMVFDANCNSIGTPGVVTNFKLIRTTGGVVSGVNETVSSATPDTAFRWDSTAKQWVFNISTKSLSASTTYYYEIDLNDGTSILFQFGLK